MALIDRLKSVWNAFVSAPDQMQIDYSAGGASYTSAPPSRPRRSYSNERTIVTAIYNRIAMDVASAAIRHIKLDEFGRYLQDMKSPLNTCLTLEPNMDQAPRSFRQDIAMTLFDRGVAAIVPVDTTVDPNTNEVFDIYTVRVGEVVNWYAKHVKVSLWNEKTARREEVILEKRYVAIVENPLYMVMNEPNSTLQRLIRKLNLLDFVDEQSGSGKLDLIIQLPYVIKSDAKRAQAEQRRSDIEFQLKDSRYGIAYTDGTEKITQLNRPAENNLLGQIEMLIKLLYSQLGITEEVMAGTANEETMLNYYNRTVEPILDAIVEAMQRSFLGPVRTQQQKEQIKYFRQPFKFVTVKDLAEIADKFARNEIMTSNEIRGVIGFEPSKDPKADQLVNSNMPQPTDTAGVQT